MEAKNQIKNFSRTLTFKFLLIGFISLLLLIPAAWIKDIIHERELRSEEVFNEISSQWGYQQHIAGPVLTIPYKTFRNYESEVIEEIHRAHFLPENLNLTGTIIPEKRYRGIFAVIVYGSDIEINGNFVNPDFTEFGVSADNILWDQAYITVGIPDMRGIQNDVRINWNDNNLDVIPGCKNTDIVKSGFHSRIHLKSEPKGNNYDFKINLEINGTRSFSVFPLGKKTTVELASKWPDPGFTGDFLPDAREIDENGFTAEWTITHLNRNYPQSWTDNEFSVNSSEFGVELIQPVDHYQRAFRSVKYAMMFIGLTFLVFLLIEILNKKRLHPIQYVLTGIALIVFYILLVSLSEHTGFTIAYIISAIAVISLISYYIWSNFGQVRFAATTFAVLTGLYLFLFVTLQLQDYALLFGSIGLFIVLGIFMLLTRKINWYLEEVVE